MKYLFLLLFSLNANAATMQILIMNSLGTTLANKTVTVGDNLFSLYVSKFGNRNGYQPILFDANGNPSANPENKYEFMSRLMRQYLANEINAQVLVETLQAAQAGVNNVSF